MVAAEGALGMTARRPRRRPRALATQIDTVLKRAAADLSEAEAVHDLRVACRRLEAGTRLAGDVLSPKRRRRLRDAAKAIRRAFDQARDLEVIAAELGQIPGLSPAFLAGVAAAAQHHEASAAAHARIQDDLDTLQAIRARLTEDDVPPRAALAATLGAHISDFFAALARLAPESTDTALHEFRIAAKKLRYEMEIARPVFPRLEAQITRVKRLQDIIGRHQDAYVGLHWAEALTEGELGATAADRFALMRYYAALRQQQRRDFRRLRAAWLARDLRARFLAAVGT